jgi:hypothetical protein
VDVEISGPTVGFLAAELAGLGRRLELVDPPEARAALRALAEELRGLYAESSGGGLSRPTGGDRPGR